MGWWVGTGILGSVSLPVFHNGGLFCGAWDVEGGGEKKNCVEAGPFFSHVARIAPPPPSFVSYSSRFVSGGLC